MHSLNTELKRVLDTLAPEKEKRVSLKTKHPWYNQGNEDLKETCKKTREEMVKVQTRFLLDCIQESKEFLLNHKKKDMIRHKISECSPENYINLSII